MVVVAAAAAAAVVVAVSVVVAVAAAAAPSLLSSCLFLDFLIGLYLYSGYFLSCSNFSFLAKVSQ